MFNISTKKITQAVSAAKQLKATAAVLYASKHGVLFATRSDAGTFISRLSKERQEEAALQVNLEGLTNATYRTSDLAMKVNVDHLLIKSKKSRSVIKLAAEAVEPGSLLELWKKKSTGKEVPELSRMLAENQSLFMIKDHVGNKPVPVHLRWNNKGGVAAGMSDQYHGISVRTRNAPVDKAKSHELFVYSSWLPLLIEYLTGQATAEPVTEEKGAAAKGGENKKSLGEPATLNITEESISVSTEDHLLVLQAIVPGADTITLDEVSQIASAQGKNTLTVSMEDINAALKRSLSVLRMEDAIQFSSSGDNRETLRISGTSDSGSRIVEEVKSSEPKKPFKLSCTVYNLLDITNACVPQCKMSRADKALLFSYEYGSRSDIVYEVQLFSAVTSA